MKNAIILFFLGFSLALGAQETVTLRVNYNPGESYLMTVNTTSQVGQEMFTNVSVEMTMNVLDRQDENFLTESKFTRIIMDMMQGGNEMSYDSNMSDDDLDATGKMMKAQMSPMLSATIKSTVTPMGENTNVTIVPQEAANAGNFANQNGIIYPEKALKIGDSWKDTKSANGLTMNTTYTLKELTSDQIILDVSGNTSGMSEGTISGYVHIDRASGMAKESKVIIELEVMGKPMKTEAVVTMVKL